MLKIVFTWPTALSSTLANTQTHSFITKQSLSLTHTHACTSSTVSSLHAIDSTEVLKKKKKEKKKTSAPQEGTSPRKGSPAHLGFDLLVPQGPAAFMTLTLIRAASAGDPPMNISRLVWASCLADGEGFNNPSETLATMLSVWRKIKIWPLLAATPDFGRWEAPWVPSWQINARQS